MYTVSGNDLSEKTKFQLNGEISSLAYSPNGEFLAVTSGRNIMVHETASYQVRLSVCLSGHLSSVCVSAYLSVFCPCVCPFVCLSTCLPAHPSACCCYIWWWWWCSVASFPGLPTVQFLIVYCSLVPKPRPAFCHLQYGKVMESWAGPGNEAMFTVCKNNGKPFYHVNNVNVYLGRQRERGVPDCKNELETFSCGFHQSRKLTAPCSGQRMKREMCSFDSGSLSSSV